MRNTYLVSIVNWFMWHFNDMVKSVNKTPDPDLRGLLKPIDPFVCVLVHACVQVSALQS